MGAFRKEVTRLEILAPVFRDRGDNNLRDEMDHHQYLESAPVVVIVAFGNNKCHS